MALRTLCFGLVVLATVLSTGCCCRKRCCCSPCVSCCTACCYGPTGVAAAPTTFTPIPATAYAR